MINQQQWSRKPAQENWYRTSVVKNGYLEDSLENYQQKSRYTVKLLIGNIRVELIGTAMNT